MRFAKNSLRLSVLAGLCALSSVAQAMLDNGELIIVHPFQWTYDNIAKECTEVLGPNGYDGVQISPPAEHINRDDVWWAVYQPVNFNNFTTMVGDEAQLKKMIKTCNEAGVKVFADAVFNQRASDSQEVNGRGYGGSTFSNRNYPDMKYDDFHDFRCGGIDYGNAWSVRNCDLEGMPDLKTENDYVRGKIAAYLQKLLDMGVYGFRIDAAKHMTPDDVASILGKAGNPPAYMEVIPGENQPVHPSQYTEVPNSVVIEFKYCEKMQDNIYNPQHLINMDDSWMQIPGYASEVFVANHDNERSSAGSQYLTYQKDGWAFQLAQSFMVAYPFGTVRQVYSGYEFSYHNQPGPIRTDRCQGGWHCEHRESIVNNAVGFARATRGLGVSSKGADGKVIWFNRGTKGFYALNAGDNDVTKEFPVTVPDGEYCEILQQDDKCGGQQITVAGGKASITVKAHKAAAICYDDSDSGFCGGKSVDICEKAPESTACICKNSPDAAVCVGDRYYVGTTTSWKSFTKMNYSESLKAWTLDLELDGKDDKGGVQRFKITDQPDWNGTIYGTVDGKVLCSDTVTCEDVEIDGLVGKYTLTVDRTNHFKFVKKGDVIDFTPSFTTEVSGLKVRFTNTTFADPADAAGAKYRWYFGDGTESSKANPVHTYAESGKYKVTLKVKKDGKKLGVKNKVQVKEPCKPNNPALYFAGTSTKWAAKPFTFNTDTCLWEINVKFTGKSDEGGKQRFRIYDSADMNGTVWGKGTKNTLCSNPDVCGDIFVSQVGKYRVKINDYKLKYALDPLDDSNHVPVASFDAVTDGLTVTFTSTATDADGDKLSYIWSFGDGSKGSGAVVTHTYDAEGNYKIKHVVNDGKVDSATAAKVVPVTDIEIPKTHDALYFAGTSNSWVHDAMTYNPRTGDWSIDLVLSGQGDTKGSQRFKVTEQDGWSGAVWGDAGGNALCSNEFKCGDVKVSEVGNYTLYVKDADMTWSLIAR